MRTALITFGIDASHGYERIHMDALRSIAELVVHYSASAVEIPRDAEERRTLKASPSSRPCRRYTASTILRQTFERTHAPDGADAR